jgi:hypothetical protein
MSQSNTSIVMVRVALPLVHWSRGVTLWDQASEQSLGILGATLLTSRYQAASAHHRSWILQA